jgi:hypothetical protein
MGQAFSGPKAFDFLPFTKEAKAVLKANPMLLAVLFIVLSAMGLLVAIAWYIHYETGKPYAKPKVKKGDEKKGGSKA